MSVTWCTSLAAHSIHSRPAAIEDNGSYTVRHCHRDSEALKHIIEIIQTVKFTKHDCRCLIRFAAWFILFVFANATCVRQQVPLDKLFWWKMSRGQNWSATCQAEQMRKGSKEHIELH